MMESVYLSAMKVLCSVLIALMLVLLVLDALLEHDGAVKRLLYLLSILFILAHTIYVAEYAIEFNLRVLVLPLLLVYIRGSNLALGSGIISVDLGQLVALALVAALLKKALTLRREGA